MIEPWKVILCDSDQCIEEMSEPETPGEPVTRLNNTTIQEYQIWPDVDTEEVTQFTCPRCGKVTTWGKTRRHVAKVMYERLYGN